MKSFSRRSFLRLCGKTFLALGFGSMLPKSVAAAAKPPALRVIASRTLPLENDKRFRAIVFSRWGKKLYEWNDPAGGWDGRSGGSDVPDGAYYLNIEARGADGKNYHIKKTINLLRGYTEDRGGGTNP